MASQIAPALVSSPRDLVDYRVSDALPVNASMTDGYVERYIHSEIYKKYSEVHAVIHSHAESVIPYSVSGESPQALPPVPQTKTEQEWRCNPVSTWLDF